MIPSPIADLVPSGTLFEMYPIGLSFLGEYLERHGLKARVVNLAARMLEQPGFNAERFVARQRPGAFGIDLHWLPHCHGSVELARLCKRAHPDIPVIMGGYTASVFHRELLDYPEVDFVIRGDSAEEPLLQLLRTLERGSDLGRVPNLTWRDRASGDIVANPVSYVPADLDHIGRNYAFMVRSAARYLDWRGVRAFKGWWSYPLTAVLTVKGCTRNCTFCGGSASSMARCFGRRGVALRSPPDIAEDVRAICSFTGAPVFLVGDLRQPGDDFAVEVLERLRRVRPRNHVVLELFEPAPDEFFRLAGEALSSFDVQISPESHDESVRMATGKYYSNSAFEETVERALEHGCGRLDIFFMIGLEGQTVSSVRETVGYCARLLDRFGVRVHPFMGPLAPFLDPGSINREKAGEHGYTVLLHSLEEHRNALLEPHWRDLLGYETRWMTRQQIVDVTYEALLELNRVKEASGQITHRTARDIDRLLRENISLLGRFDAAGEIEDSALKAAELERIRRDAGKLRAESDLFKRELDWPVESPRFRYSGLARLALAQRGAA